jgi:hypothetical protein
MRVAAIGAMAFTFDAQVGSFGGQHPSETDKPGLGDGVITHVLRTEDSGGGGGVDDAAIPFSRITFHAGRVT